MSSAYFLLPMLSVFFLRDHNLVSAAAPAPTFTIKEDNSPESTGNNTAHPDDRRLGNYMPLSNYIAAKTTNHEGFMFTMDVHIGQQAIKQRLVLDTESELTWTQCYPIDKGFPLDQSLRYDREVSGRHFTTIPASHYLCDSLKGYKSAEGGKNCAYRFKDSSNRPFGGFLAREMFHLESSRFVNDLVFGCSVDNDPSFFAGNAYEGISGVFGLGPGHLSFASQSSDMVEDKFAYCVPGEGGQSHLRLGSDILPPPLGAKTVPMIEAAAGVDSPLKSKYLLYLTGVAIDGKRLNLRNNYHAAIDTRFRKSRIPSIMQSKLVPEIDRYLESRGVKRARGTNKVCYFTPFGFADYPIVSFDFGGTTRPTRRATVQCRRKIPRQAVGVLWDAI